MSPARPVDWIAITVMLVLCMSWAFQQIAVKLALPEIGPMAQGAIRSAGATILVAAFVMVRRRRSPWMAGLNGPGILAGILFGAEFILLFAALTYTDAARAVMLLYTAPFVVGIGSHLLFPGERLDAKSAIGIALAFVGVALTLSPKAGHGQGKWIGDLLALGAGILWGLTTLLIKGTRLRFGPPAQVLLYQLAVSAVMFAGAALWTGQPLLVPMSGVTLAAVLYQVAWVASLTFGIWYALITVYSPTSLSVITFVTPIFGAIMGYLFLGEPLALQHGVGVLTVAAGIVLVTLPRGRRLFAA